MLLYQVLIGLILGLLVIIARVQWVHHKWVKREFHHNALAHTRIVKALPPWRREPVQVLPIDFHRTRVWPQAQPAPEPEDWNDDFPRTEDLTGFCE
jgi:hypothetical protein